MSFYQNICAKIDQVKIAPLKWPTYLIEKKIIMIKFEIYNMFF